MLLRHDRINLVDRADISGSLPLVYACANKCLEAVQLMLDADSALLSLESAKRDFFRMDRRYHDFWETCGHATDEIRDHLRKALVDRRIRLKSLASTHLCRQEMKDLGISDDRLLDENAFTIHKALERKKVALPTALRVPLFRTTIYHIYNPAWFPRGSSYAVSESLYGCGFMDIDGTDYQGLTPMMRTPLEATFNIKPILQRALWLISKGADLGRRAKPHEHMPATPSSTAAHYMCSWVGRAIRSNLTEKIDRTWLSDGVTNLSHCTSRYSAVTEKTDRAWLFRIFEQLGNDCRALLEAMLSSEFYDCCLCACSSQGCTPAIMMLKKGNVSSLELHSFMIEWFTTTLKNRHEVWQWLSQEIIRYETFEKLELTHTCCESKGLYNNLICTRHDSTERKEIRDEERLLISKLETLVAEFTGKYNEIGVSLPDFLNGYWNTRMEEVEREGKPLDDEDFAKIEELGVIIHS